jgi:hypothetical protein
MGVAVVRVEHAGGSAARVPRGVLRLLTRRFRARGSLQEISLVVEQVSGTARELELAGRSAAFSWPECQQLGILR